MKNIKHIKKIFIIIAIIIVIILICIFSLSYTINKNNNYLSSISTKINKHYKLKDKITYANIYGNYYIFTTKKEVFVLNKEYEKVLQEDLYTIKERKENHNLIYKTKQLMYENTITKDNKITYEYYDAKNYKKISSITLEE